MDQELDRAEYSGPPIPTPWKIIAELRLKDPHVPVKDLAKMVGYSSQSVHMWLKKPEYQRYENWLIAGILPEISPAEVAERKTVLERVKERFQTHAEEMQERLLTILDTCDDPRIQKEIALDWLDRSGAGAPRSSDNRQFNLIVTPEVAEEFFRRADEAGLKSVEAEVVADGHP